MFMRVVVSEFGGGTPQWSLFVAEEGLAWLSMEWKLCQPLKNKTDVKNLKDYLTNVWTNLAMVDYPYPANFLAPLPAYPIKVSFIFLDGTLPFFVHYLLTEGN